MPVKDKQLKNLARKIISKEKLFRTFEENKNIVAKYINRQKYKKHSNQIAGLLVKYFKKNDSI